MRLGLVAGSLLACGAAVAPQASGETLFRKANCHTCHGVERKGNAVAPPLLDLGRSWDADRLAAYLRDPFAASKGDPRLQELQKRFPAVMPPYGGSETDRRVLAAWLLEAGR